MRPLVCWEVSHQPMMRPVARSAGQCDGYAEELLSTAPPFRAHERKIVPVRFRAARSRWLPPRSPDAPPATSELRSLRRVNTNFSCC